MEKITWTAGNGSTIEITANAELGANLSGRQKTTGRKDVKVRGFVDGKEEQFCYLQKIDHPTCAAKFGRIGITRDNLDRIEAAIAAEEAAVAEHNAAIDRKNAEVNDVVNNSRKLARQMAHGEV